MRELITGVFGFLIILLIIFLCAKFSIQPRLTNIKNLKTVYKVFFAVMFLGVTLWILGVGFLPAVAVSLGTPLIIVILPLIYSVYGATWFVASLVFLAPMIWIIIPIKLWFFTKSEGEKTIRDLERGVT